MYSTCAMYLDRELKSGAKVVSYHYTRVGSMSTPAMTYHTGLPPLPQLNIQFVEVMLRQGLLRQSG